MVQGSAMPDPDQIADLAEFAAALDALRLWAGAPSYRTLARRVGPLLPVPRTVAASTVIDVFKPKRRRLDFDLVVAIVRSLGLEGAAVERWRAACLRVHAEAKAGGPVGVFRQLPAGLSTFTGRETEVGRLIKSATAGTGGGVRTVLISAVEGMGGVGKTQLAVHVAHELVRQGWYGDVQLYANLRGFDGEQPPSAPTDVLEGFLRALGVAGAKIPPTLDARAAMFRDRLHDLDALVLLDNAADEQQIRDLIPAGPNCLVLVTSRRTLAGLDGAELHRLDVFQRSEALALLERTIGADRVAAEPDAAVEIAEACGRLPLAIALAGARLRARPALGLADLAERLRESGLEVHSAGSRTLRAVFDVSYQGISVPARRLFRLLGLNPGADITAFAAAALADERVAPIRDLLDELVDHHLVEPRGSDRFALHDLLQAYAREQLDVRDDETERRAALIRLFDHYRYTAWDAANWYNDVTACHRPDIAEPPTQPVPIADRDRATAWLDAERANLITVAERALAVGMPAYADDLSRLLSYYLRVRSHFGEAIRLHTLGAEGARALGEPDQQAWSLYFLAAIAGGQGRDQDSLRHLEEGLGLARDVWLRASLIGGVGTLAVVTGDYRKAVACKEEDYRSTLAVSTKESALGPVANLGFTYYYVGRYREAIRLQDEAEAMAEDVWIIETKITRGLVLERTGDYDEATAQLVRALAECRAKNARWPEAHALGLLGLVQGRQGHEDEAVASLDQALAMHREFDNRLGEVDAELWLGGVHFRSGRADRAAACFERALTIARASGFRGREPEALIGLGAVALLRGHACAAVEHLSRALEQANTSGDPYWEAKAHEGLGDAHRALGDDALADDHLGQALEEFTRLGVPDAAALRNRWMPGQP